MFEFGNSGDILQIVSKGVVRKTECDGKRNKLVNQCLKQANFKSTHEFFAPTVFGYGTKDDLFWFDMSYIEGCSPLDFLCQADKSSIICFVNSVTSFLEQEVKESNMQEVEMSVFEQKIFSLNVEDILKEKLLRLVELVKKPLLLPVGRCHGDFTISNMIFAQGKICLLDFLPCYLESPLQDIAKLRQDTRHLWLLHKTTNPNLDLVRLKMVLQFMDTRVVEVFSTYHWYNDYYDLFQQMNLSRILPYTKTNKLLTLFLEEQINNQCLTH